MAIVLAEARDQVVLIGSWLIEGFMKNIVYPITQNILLQSASILRMEKNHRTSEKYGYTSHSIASNR